MYDTLAEIVAAVRSDINEETEGFWKDTDIKRWIREGQNDVAEKSLCFQKDYTENNLTGQKFDLPSDFIEEHRVFVDDNIVEHIDKEPKSFGYLIWENKLRFNFDLNDSELNLFYYRYPTLMSEDTDSPELLEPYRYLLGEFAKYKAKINDRKTEEAKIIYELYLDGIRDLKKRYGNRPKTTKVKVIRW